MLDVDKGSIADGANVIQWTDNGGNNQKWNIVDLGNGYYKLISINSGKVLAVYNNSTTNGVNIVQTTDNGGTNEQWQLVQQ